MSDYPMLISNKLHSFRNFGHNKVMEINCFVDDFGKEFVLKQEK